MLVSILRKYIFTERERGIIQTFLDGKRVGSMDIARIKYMARTFERLHRDVGLYLEFIARITEPEST
jgi:hypothetical protein